MYFHHLRHAAADLVNSGKFAWNAWKAEIVSQENEC